MPVRIGVLAALGILVPVLPGRIMKSKHKEDLAGKTKRIAVTVLSEIAFLAADAWLLVKEPDLISFLLLSAILMLSGAIVIIDTRCRIIPNLCLFPMLLLATGYLVRSIVMGADWGILISSTVSMIFVCFGMIALTNMLHFQGYLGAGDIKYCAVGAYLFSFSARFAGMLIGIVVSMLIYLIPMLLAKKITLKSLIAFGPFIGFGMMSGICGMYLPIAF